MTRIGKGRSITINQYTNRIFIRDSYIAFVDYSGAITSDINAVTAAAHIQLAVLVHHRVVTRDFSSGRTLSVNGGIATVVGRRIITRNAGSGAAIKDRAVTVVVDDGFVTVNLSACG
ncbi:putative mucin-2 (MUC-2) (Intestinal mucin-2), partial [Escherichia coli TA014]